MDFSDKLLGEFSGFLFLGRARWRSEKMPDNCPGEGGFRMSNLGVN